MPNMFIAWNHLTHHVYNINMIFLKSFDDTEVNISAESILYLVVDHRLVESHNDAINPITVESLSEEIEEEWTLILSIYRKIKMMTSQVRELNPSYFWGWELPGINLIIDCPK